MSAKKRPATPARRSATGHSELPLVAATLLRAVAPHKHHHRGLPAVMAATDRVVAAVKDFTFTDDPEGYAIEACIDFDAEFIDWSRREDPLRVASDDRARAVAALEAAGLDATEHVNNILISGAMTGFTIGLLVACKLLAGGEFTEGADEAAAAYRPTGASPAVRGVRRSRSRQAAHCRTGEGR